MLCEAVWVVWTSFIIYYHGLLCYRLAIPRRAVFPSFNIFYVFWSGPWSWKSDSSNGLYVALFGRFRSSRSDGWECMCSPIKWSFDFNIHLLAYITLSRVSTIWSKSMFCTCWILRELVQGTAWFWMVPWSVQIGWSIGECIGCSELWKWKCILSRISFQYFGNSAKVWRVAHCFEWII